MTDDKPTGSQLESIGSRLRHARLAAGYKTQAKFSLIAGVDKTTYNAHEKGRTGIPISTASRYSKLLNCDLAWLLTGEGSTRSDSNAVHLPGIIEEDVQSALRLITARLGAGTTVKAKAVSFTDPEASILREAVDLFLRVHGDARPYDVELSKSALTKVWELTDS